MEEGGGGEGGEEGRGRGRTLEGLQGLGEGCAVGNFILHMFPVSLLCFHTSRTLILLPIPFFLTVCFTCIHIAYTCTSTLQLLMCTSVGPAAAVGKSGSGQSSSLKETNSSPHW